jgi:hypothetical protein
MIAYAKHTVEAASMLVYATSKGIIRGIDLRTMKVEWTFSPPPSDGTLPIPTATRLIAHASLLMHARSLMGKQHIDAHNVTVITDP